MNPAASRAQLVRGMQSLHLAGPAPSRSRATAVAMAAARGISTTTTQRGKNTDWVRGKLWKGEAPGAADPYTQRPEPEVAQASEADAATTVESSLGDSTAAQQQQQQGVPLPPRRSAAATITDVKAADPTYEPATSLEELAEVQPLSQWWEQPGHWTARDEFRGFPSPEVVRDPAVIEVYLRRALVEVLALRDTASFRKWSTQTWSEGRGTGPVLDAEVAVRDGNAFLTANVRTINMDLKTGRKHRVAGRHQKRMDAAEAAKLIERWSPEWKKTVLRDAQKFVVRIYSILCSMFVQRYIILTHVYRFANVYTSSPAT